MDNYHESLLWLQSARKAGMPDFEIRSQLKASGWQHQQIEELYGLASVTDSVTGKGPHELIHAKKKRNTLLLIILSAIILAGAGFAAYWFFIKEKGKSQNQSNANTQQGSSQTDNTNNSNSSNRNSPLNSSTVNQNTNTNAVNLDTSTMSYKTFTSVHKVLQNDFTLQYPASYREYAIQELTNIDLGDSSLETIFLANTNECFEWLKEILISEEQPLMKEGCVQINVRPETKDNFESYMGEDVEGDYGIRKKSESITIDSWPGEKVIIFNEDPNEIYISASAFEPVNTNQVYRVGIVFEAITTPSGEKQAESILDAMVASFKFVE